MKKITFTIFLLGLIASNASASALGDAIVAPFRSVLSDYYLIIIALVALSILLFSSKEILYLLSEESKVDKAYKSAFPKDSRSHIVKLTKQERAQRVLDYKKERLASVGQTQFSDKQKKQQRKKLQRKNRNFRKLSQDEKFKRLDDFKTIKSSFEDKQNSSSSIQSDAHSKKVNEFLESRQAKRQTKLENRHNSDWLNIPEPTPMEQYQIDLRERKRIQRILGGSF
jgi:hypothetical protein